MGIISYILFTALSSGLSAPALQPDTAVIRYMPGDGEHPLADESFAEDTTEYSLILDTRNDDIPLQFFILDTTIYTVPQHIVKNYRQYHWNKMVPRFLKKREKTWDEWKRLKKTKVLYFYNENDQKKAPRGYVRLKRGEIARLPHGCVIRENVGNYKVEIHRDYW